MTNEFKAYILKNVPTKILLRDFKTQRNPRYKDYYDEHWNVVSDYKLCPDFIDYSDYKIDMRFQIIVPRFAYWNPYKGHGCTCYYTLYEVKMELNNRGHINRK